MLHITRETFPETKEITLKGVQWKQDAHIVIETSCSGDNLDVTLALHRNRGAVLLGKIQLDDCVPEEYLPEATMHSDFMRWWQEEHHDPKDLYEELMSIRLAKTAHVAFTYDSQSEGVLVEAQWGEFKTSALLRRSEAQRYFVR